MVLDCLTQVLVHTLNCFSVSLSVCSVQWNKSMYVQWFRQRWVHNGQGFAGVLVFPCIIFVRTQLLQTYRKTSDGDWVSAIKTRGGVLPRVCLGLIPPCLGLKSECHPWWATLATCSRSNVLVRESWRSVNLCRQKSACILACLMRRWGPGGKGSRSPTHWPFLEDFHQACVKEQTFQGMSQDVDRWMGQLVLQV